MAPADPPRPTPWGAWEPEENQLRKRILPLPEMGNDPRETIYFLPSSWTPDARLPLVIALGGGRAIAENLMTSQPRLLLEAQRHGFLLLIPSSSMAYSSVLPSGKPLQDIHEDYVFRAIAIPREEFGADGERMFLIGFSSGGSGVWSLALRHPDRFLAIAPIAPGGSPDRDELKRIAHIPTFLAQAADDRGIRRRENRRAARALEQLGAPITFFEPVHGSHGLQEYPVIGRAFELFRRVADRAE